MIDPLIPAVSQAQSEGAVVLLKWDGERDTGGCTVVILRSDTGYSYRQDGNDMVALLDKALADYQSAH